MQQGAFNWELAAYRTIGVDYYINIPGGTLYRQVIGGRSHTTFLPVPDWKPAGAQTFHPPTPPGYDGTFLVLNPSRDDPLHSTIWIRADCVVMVRALEQGGAEIHLKAGGPIKVGDAPEKIAAAIFMSV